MLGCSSALSPSYSAYCIFRFLSGMAVSGIILNGVSLSTCLPVYLSVFLSVIKCRFSLLCVCCFINSQRLINPSVCLPVCLFSCLFPEVEWIPTKERTLVGTLTSFFFTFGQMILAGLAYWLRDWRKLQAVVCAPYFLFFAYSWSV